MPITPGCHPSPAITWRGSAATPSDRDRPLGLEQDARLDGLALGVDRVELARYLRGTGLVLGQHQLESCVGSVEPPGGVDAGSEHEPERVLGDRLRLQTGHLHQGAQPGPRRARQQPKALPDKRAVLAQQRHYVGDGGEGDDVQLPLHPGRIAARCRLKRLRQLVDDSRGTEIGAGVAANGGMDDGTVRKLGPGTMMVRNDDVHPQPAGMRDFLDGADPAVGRHEQPCAPGVETVDRRYREAVPVFHPARQQDAHLGAEVPQDRTRKRGGADPVDVVIPVYRYRVPALGMAQHQCHRLAHAGERQRVVSLGGLEEGTGGGDVLEPAPGQDGSGDRAQAQLTRELLRRGVGIWAGAPGLPRLLPGRSNDATTCCTHQPMLGSAGDGRNTVIL